MPNDNKIQFSSLEKIKNNFEKEKVENKENVENEIKIEKQQNKDEKKDFFSDKKLDDKSKIEDNNIVVAGKTQAKQKEQNEKIGKILENGLEEVYINMPINKQIEFKKEGEKIVKEINNLLNKAKVNLKKIVNLIKKWLFIIPGVNKFFLEQEAKIKADEIIKNVE